MGLLVILKANTLWPDDLMIMKWNGWGYMLLLKLCGADEDIAGVVEAQKPVMLPLQQRPRLLRPSSWAS